MRDGEEGWEERRKDGEKRRKDGEEGRMGRREGEGYNGTFLTNPRRQANLQGLFHQCFVTLILHWVILPLEHQG